MRAVVGVDFDNTMVSYDAIIHRAAVDRGLIAPETDRLKRTVRDRIRLRPDGEIEWQRLQALVYGPLMAKARLIDGVPEFVRACRQRGRPVYVVSHKTEFAGNDETGTNLRGAAIDWMTAHRFFDRGGLGLRREDVFFESTRDAKIDRIRSLGCTHFIDDLEEVFRESCFPPGIEKLLLAPEAPPDLSRDVKVLPTWTAIDDYVFGRRG